MLPHTLSLNSKSNRSTKPSEFWWIHTTLQSNIEQILWNHVLRNLQSSWPKIELSTNLINSYCKENNYSFKYTHNLQLSTLPQVFKVFLNLTGKGLFWEETVASLNLKVQPKPLEPESRVLMIGGNYP